MEIHTNKLLRTHPPGLKQTKQYGNMIMDTMYLYMVFRLKQTKQYGNEHSNISGDVLNEQFKID